MRRVLLVFVALVMGGMVVAAAPSVYRHVDRAMGRHHVVVKVKAHACRLDHGLCELSIKMVSGTRRMYGWIGCQRKYRECRHKLGLRPDLPYLRR